MKTLRFRVSAVNLFLLIVISCSTQLAQENSFPEITSKDISEAEITRTEYFDGTSLWGYIDGAADVYLEYGFDKLLVQELKWKKHKFVINIYQMNNPEAAFGIYSISQHKCNPADTLPNFTCITSHQVQFAKNHSYISIINEKGSEEEQVSNIKLMEIIKNKITGVNFSIPELFTNPELYKNIEHLKFFSGTLGLQNGYPDWLDLFDGIEKYQIYLLPIEQNNKYINIAAISFQNKDDLKSFSDNSDEIKKGKFHLILKKDENKIFFLESNKSANELTDLIKTIKK